MIILPDRYTNRMIEAPRQRVFFVYADYQRNLLLCTAKSQEEAIAVLDRFDRNTDGKTLLGSAFNKGSEIKAELEAERFEREHAERVEKRLEDRERLG